MRQVETPTLSSASPPYNQYFNISHIMYGIRLGTILGIKLQEGPPCPGFLLVLRGAANVVEHESGLREMHAPSTSPGSTKIQDKNKSVASTELILLEDPNKSDAHTP